MHFFPQAELELSSTLELDGVGTWPGVVVVVGNRDGCSGGVVEGERVSFGVGGKETRDGEDTTEVCVILMRGDGDR